MQPSAFPIKEPLMRWLIIAFALILLTPLRFAAAHPHAWTDIAVEILFDNTGSVTGLRQTWLFDDLYTAFAVEGIITDGDDKPDQDVLDEILQVNIRNLKEYNYFTKIWLKDATLKLKPVTEMATQMREKRLEMTFVTSLDTPVPFPNTGFSYAIFDPSYYIEVLHTNTAAPVILSGAPDGCEYTLSPPTPGPSDVVQATLLDASMRKETGLGIFFAERVSLKCTTE